MKTKSAMLPEALPLWPSPSTTNVKGRVWNLSRTALGSREVQRALELAVDDEARADIASELRGHTWAAMQCPHANFVLQKCIMTLRPQALQFIIDEIMSKSGALLHTAQHKYGCRIVQRLLEHCRFDQVQRLVDVILQDAVELACHPFGNYVLQHTLEYSPDGTRDHLIELLVKHVNTMAADTCAAAVVSQAMSIGNKGAPLARALFKERGLLRTMACSRHGHIAVKRALRLLSADEFDKAVEQLTSDAQALRADRYGKIVLASLESNERQRACSERVPRATR